MTSGQGIDDRGGFAAWLSANRARLIGELGDLIRIPSVSALPAHADDMVRAAGWVADRLRAAGVPQVEVVPTAGHPVVLGEWPAADPAAPTVLIYAHYDTQPADPFDEWETPPFEPSERDGRLYARGASDDKGNVLIPVAVAEAFGQLAGGPPLGLIFFFEGEEEIGSPNLRPFLAANRDRLRATVAISADSGMWSHEQPSLVLASKGLAGVQLDARGAAGDLHSGLHGGLAPNPLGALATVLASMKDAYGQITIDGFFDGVRPLSQLERAEIAAVPFDEADYGRSIGIAGPVGDPAFTPLERNWARPTLDLNGIWGGFQGAGSKTVIPAEAHAKITCRLVPDQDPGAIIAAIARHVAIHTPPGVTISVNPTAGSSSAYAIDPQHPALVAARAVMREEYGLDPYMIRLGGTLPVAEFFKTDLGLDTIFLAWEMPDENLHGPNEFFRLENFDRGFRVYQQLFARLAANRWISSHRVRGGTMSTANDTSAPATLDWPGTLVDTGWLADHLGHPALRIVDMRGYVKTTPLGNGQQKAEYTGAQEEYAAGHIPGAVYIDWTSDIINPDDPIPAQLATPEAFAALMGRLGIGDDAYVVIYDHKGTQFATRMWWALGYYGHGNAAILDGGWAKWSAEGRPTTTETPTYPAATFTPKAGRQGRVTAQEVLEHSELGDAIIVDARDREQYTGAIARGEKGGHIPGAIHVPNANLFTAEGTWKSDDELRQIMTDAGLDEEPDRPIVAYCNGGVAATTVLFALDRLGRPGHNYDGSWNEWGNDPNLPARTGEQP